MVALRAVCLGAGQVESSPTLSADGSVMYVGSDDNSLYAVNT